MSRISRVLILAFVGALLMIPAAIGQAAPTEVTGAVRQPVTLDNEQVHTVLQTQHWYGNWYVHPKAGSTYVTIRVAVQALQQTSYNPLYYQLVAQGGAAYGTQWLGPRQPQLRSSAAMPAGATTSGWLTFLVPTAKRNGLTLVYRMHGGFGSTLRVPLGVIPDSPRTIINRAVVLEGEQSHTVTRVAHPAKLGRWIPARGYAYVTVYVKVRALKQTLVGSRYYALLTRTGRWYGAPTFGRQSPVFPSSRSVRTRTLVQGWLTFMVPKSLLKGLTLVYHSPDPRSGTRTDLLVRLPG